MQRMTRVAAVPALVLLLAACAGPGTGAGGSTSAAAQPSGSSSPGTGAPASMPAASGEASATPRIDIGSLTADPGAYEGQSITVLARVDEVVVDGQAFLTSPNATADGQIAVIIKPGAQVDKEPTARGVVWVDGTVVGSTAEDLQAAGVDLSADELGGYSGAFVIVADAIRDPLASDG
jgi:hypothetical protein